MKKIIDEYSFEEGVKYALQSLEEVYGQSISETDIYAEYFKEVKNDYPKELNGEIVWACCVSIIDAGNCNHLRARDGRPLRGNDKS